MLSAFAGRTTPADYTERWVSSQADGAGNGTTPTIGGTNGAWTLGQAFANATSGHLVRVMDDGTYTLIAGLSAVNSGGNQYIVLVGHDNQNGPNANNGRPIINCNGYAIDMANRTTWWLERLRIQNGPATPSPVITNSRAYHWDLELTAAKCGIAGGAYFLVAGCNFHDMGDAGAPNSCYAVQGGTPLIIDSLFINIAGSAAKSPYTSNRLTVIGCHFQNVNPRALNDIGIGSLSALNTFYNCATAILASDGARQDIMNIITNATVGIEASSTKATSVALQNVLYGNTSDATGKLVNVAPITADPKLLNPPADLRPHPTGAAYNLEFASPLTATNRINAGCYQGQGYAGPWSDPTMHVIALNEPSATARQVLFRLVSSADGQTPISGLIAEEIGISLTKPGGTPGTISHPDITDIGNGWYRYSLEPSHVDAAGTALLRATHPTALAAEVHVLISPVITDAARAAAGIAAIGTPNVSVKSPFVADGEWELQAGDDYTGEAAILKTWHNYDGHDPAGAHLLVIVTDAADYESGGAAPAILSKDLGAIITATLEDDGSVTLSAAIALTKEEVNSLSPTPPADRFAYYYQIALETPTAQRTTLERGRLTVWAAAD